MVELRAVTQDNLEDVLNLDILEQQEAFVSSNAYSLAQAYVYRETAFPFAIYADNTIVGFIMLGYYEDRKQFTLWKFMIDKRYQDKGYGRQALKQGIVYLKDKSQGLKELKLFIWYEARDRKRELCRDSFASGFLYSCKKKVEMLYQSFGIFGVKRWLCIGL